MTGKQGAAEWLRGIVDKSCGKENIPLCTEITEPFFGIECREMHTCGSCILAMLTAIADRIDAERALPADVEWPRFEDGGLVRIGDELEFEGKTMLVGDATFYADDWALWCSREGIDGRLSGSYGERVKRPAPKVLGADGAPIEVGDTVYCDDDPESLTVDSFGGAGCVYITLAKSPDGILYTKEPSRLSHERPDSWERLEQDARKTACNYALAPRDEDGITTCDGCRFQKSESCSNEMTLDVVERAKKLAGIEEEAQ